MFGNNIDNNALLSLLGQLGLGQNMNTGMNPQMMRGQILMSKLIQQTQSQKPMQQVMAQKATLPMPSPVKRNFQCSICDEIKHKQRTDIIKGAVVCKSCSTKARKANKLKKEDIKKHKPVTLNVNGDLAMMQNLQKIMSLMKASGAGNFNQQVNSNEVNELKGEIAELKRLLQGEK